jgi:hypothetical protein
MESGEAEQGCCWSRMPVGGGGRVRAEREFLQDQVIPNLVEGREWHAAHDDGSKMIIAPVHLPKNVEDKVAVGDDAATVGHGVGHALHLATVVTHRGVTLDEVVEHGVEV